MRIDMAWISRDREQETGYRYSQSKIGKR
jgi:hypothetical protein